LGYFVWKITILRQKIIFFPILGGAAIGHRGNIRCIFKNKNRSFNLKWRILFYYSRMSINDQKWTKVNGQ
jgi:hypothetical protein